MDWCTVVLLSLCFCYASGGYTITFPRKWVSEENTQGCITLTEPSTGSDVISVTIKNYIASHERDKKVETFGEKKTYSVPPGIKVECFELLVPFITDNEVTVEVAGNLLGSVVSYNKTVSIVRPEKTYIQTDKYLYKPGQTVQFRILTLKGPFLTVQNDNYEEIIIENPSSSRIAQWTNVDNSAGLIHLSFPLSEEPDEGEYKIRATSSSKKSETQTFKVEDYVLPRYEVKVNPPSYVLATDKEVVFEVCAHYTFGQPVKGNASLFIDNGGWSRFKVELSKDSKIAGCKKIPVTSEELKINSDRYNVYSISARATVVEEGTGVELKADSVSVDITRTALTFEDISTQKYRKPELPYIGEVLATFPDSSPAINEPMKVCVYETCKNMTTNNNGVLKFAVPPHLKGRISIHASNYGRIAQSEKTWRSIMYASEHHLSVKTYHSPSNSSLIIALGEEKIKCTHDDFITIDVPVRYSASKQGKTDFHIQVISRGQMQFVEDSVQDLSGSGDIQVPEDLFIAPMNSSATNNRGSFTVPVALSSYVSPKAEVLVWYVRDNGEVVSDHRTVDITNCLPIAAKLKWSVTTARPGEQASLSLSSKPNALCSLGVVDKSVELLASGSSKLNKKKLIDLAQKSSIEDYENSQIDDYEYCKDKFNDSDPIIPLPRPGPIPLRRERRSSPIWPSRFYSDDVDAISMFNEAGVYVLSDLTLESRPCNRNYDIFDFYYPMPMAAPGPPGARPGPPVVAFSPPAAPAPMMPNEGAIRRSEEMSVRTYFPETWLWDLMTIENGTTNLPLTLPDTVTEWVGRAVCVHSQLGVGLSNAARITTFRDFFVDLTLPPTAKQGEIFPVKISVFNYLEEKLPVKVFLLENPDFEILGEGGVPGSGERFGCIDAQDKSVYDIKIRLKEAGKVNLTVDAMIDINDVKCGSPSEERRDVIIKTIQVDYEGFPKEETRNKYVCLKENENVDESVLWELTPPVDTVEGSARAWISAVSDLMGPTLENLGNLVKMPYGCGEQNMINFAPNIFILQYLEAVNQSKNEIGKKAIEFMEKGYQRELKYRRTDGSFSAFGQRDSSGSTWLTAFVLKSFLQSRQFIQVDSNDLVISADWLKSKQQENGCFESVGTVHHKELKGGLASGGNSALLSAYVLISLLEYESDPTAKSVRDSLFCLKADKSSEPYALSIKAYALSLAKSPDAQEAIDALLNAATRTTASISWESNIDPNAKKPSRGVAVETASYAVLALLTQDPQKYEFECVQIIKWINQQRNGQGGFVSTQDTVLALQAMALYETLLPPGKVDATVLYNVNNEVEGVFHVDEKNKLLLQKDKIPVPANIDVTFAGTGCVLVQAVMRYNVRLPEDNHAFEINVTADTPYDPSCKTKRINVCASYIKPDQKSNMAIIEVNLVSGYIPEKKDLKRIVGYGTGAFKRYEVDGSTVNFYIDEFSSEPLCASFEILREVVVENVKPGTVKIYDYYEPENAISADYTLPPIDECVNVVPSPDIESEIIPAVQVIPDPPGARGPPGPPGPPF